MLRVPSGACLPGTSVPYTTWVRNLPGRYWDPARKAWVITGLGSGDPYRTLEKAGLAVAVDQSSYMRGVDLRECITPIAALDESSRYFKVRHRLAGFETCKNALGSAARWVADDRWFLLPVTEALVAGVLRPGVIWPDNALEIIERSKPRRRELPRDVQVFAATLATAVDYPNDQDDRASWEAWTCRIPGWFGLDLYPFQRLGTISALLGHNFLASPPGVGKTRTALAVAATRKSRRTLVFCPPVMTTTWAREAEASLLHTLGGTVDGSIVPIVAKRKEPDLPENGVVVVADSLAASRHQLRSKLVAWSPDVLIYDEAHRGMTMGSQRSEAVLEIGSASRFNLPLTGTPMMSSPHQLVPLLELSGHLDPVFGGASAFLDRYCVPTRFGGWRPNRRHLNELHEKLYQHVWVRPSKEAVLPWLPKKQREELRVQVPLATYKDAHRKVLKHITSWVQSVGGNPTDDQILEYAKDSLKHISRLRAAAGVCKVPAAIEWLRLHEFEQQPDGTFESPVIVWTHHQDVTDAMVKAVPKQLGRAEVIRGGTSPEDRDRIVDEFQAGKVPVLVASITAAGVGLTLTKSCTALFVECDWTPALITQAEDRASRIGATRSLIATTMVAEGTLDEHIQQVLARKGHVLGAVTGGDVHVAVATGDDLESSRELIARLVREVVAS